MVIVFDLGKVILDFDHRIVTTRLAQLSRVSEKRIHDLIFARNLESMYDRGKTSSREFYQGVVRSLDIDIPFDEFREIWTKIFTLKEDVCDLIKTLKKRYKLILLSNTNEMHFDYAFGAFEILRAFDDYVLSYRVGARKPDPKVYLAALQRAGCHAGECIYIDDKEENVWAARRLGIQAIVFKNIQQLRRELRALNIEV